MTPAFSSTEYMNGLIVPGSWTAGFGNGGHQINVPLTDLWSNSETLSLTLIPDPGIYSAVAAALLFLGALSHRLTVSNQNPITLDSN